MTLSVRTEVQISVFYDFFSVPRCPSLLSLARLSGTMRGLSIFCLFVSIKRLEVVSPDAFAREATHPW